MDKKTILDLYDIYSEEIYSKVLSNSKLSDEISFLEDKLIESLSEKPKKLLDELNSKKSEQEELIYKEMFISGFSLATKLFLEGSQNN